LDHFTLDGPDGQHQCLVHSALWDSVLGLRYRNPIQKLPQIVVVHIIIRLFEALALLHEDCEVAHTDIKEANILFGADLSMLSEFEDEELRSPSPRKDVGGRFVYLSREMGMPSGVGRPILGDLGSCVPLNDGKEHREDIQPDIYRSPEVILDVPWTYSVDIWNVGCVVSSGYAAYVNDD
jgi:serine/threonine protein kinase